MKEKMIAKSIMDFGPEDFYHKKSMKYFKSSIKWEWSKIILHLTLSGVKTN